MDTFVGFDSAWTDNPKAPGAIAAVSVQDGRVVGWHPPRLVSFDGALVFIREVRSPDGVTLVALDQPTIVANAVGMRPVELAAASLISWLGGGVQPSNTGRVGMFCKDSPVWPFLSALGAKEDPEAARVARDGLFLIEVFPAIALASLDPDFFGQLAAPRYNPGRKTFKLADWVRVASAAAVEAEALGCADLADWCRQAGAHLKPKKANQDMLDAALCTSVAVRWRRRPREQSLMLGDLSSGYMVMPISPAVHSRLSEIASRVGVAVNGGSVACWERENGAGPGGQMLEPSSKEQMADETFDELLRLYVRPYYGPLIGNFVCVDEHFPAYLTLAARTITDVQLHRLLRDQDWRPRLTAAWFAGLTGRVAFVDVLARLLRENQGAYDDQGFCVALGLLGGETAQQALVGYLEANLPSDGYSGHEDLALGALAYLDGGLSRKYLHPALWNGDANEPLRAIQAFINMVESLRSHRVLRALPPAA